LGPDLLNNCTGLRSTNCSRNRNRNRGLTKYPSIAIPIAFAIRPKAS